MKLNLLSALPKGPGKPQGFRPPYEKARQAGSSVNIIHKHYRRLIKPKEASKLWNIHPAADSNKVISLTA